jgi:hypothetical protein
MPTDDHTFNVQLTEALQAGVDETERRAEELRRAGCPEELIAQAKAKVMAKLDLIRANARNARDRGGNARGSQLLTTWQGTRQVVDRAGEWPKIRSNNEETPS